MRGRVNLGLLSGAAAALAIVGSCTDGNAAANAPSPRREPAINLTSGPIQTQTPRTDFAMTGELTQGGWAQGVVPDGTTSLLFNGDAVPVSLDGRFFIAFDRDASAAALLQAHMANGRVAARSLFITPRSWQIEHIPLGPRPGTPPDENFLRRRAGEVARINAARQINVQSDGWKQNFIWPVRGRISGRFGAQRIYPAGPAAYHSGLDIATGASGTPFVAPADGVVILAADSPFTLEGKLLMIDHGMGLNSAFLHSSLLLVHEGDHVRQGQVIGRIGMTGRATGPHLHWSLKWRTSRLDPLLFVGPNG